MRVDATPAIFCVARQVLPLVQGVGHGVADLAIGQDLRRDVVKPCLESIEDGNAMLLPETANAIGLHFALIRLFARLAVNPVELLEELQRLLRRTAAFRRWCMDQDLSGSRSLMLCLCGRSIAADGFRACAGKHSIEDVATDGDFRQLSLERSDPQTPPDHGFVSPDGGLAQRAFAVAAGDLPCHPAVSADFGDMLVPLSGRSIAEWFDRVGAWRDDDGSISAVIGNGVVNRGLRHMRRRR
ncbi:hypothetical protein EV291_1317 [Rhizobium sp. BK068]|nr:hypothetical protein EV291_1317 [Rhizobium sp. BK068]